MLTAGSLLLLPGVLALDIRVGPEISLSILYVGPIVMLAWSAGAVAGVALALGASLAWFFLEPGGARLEAVPLWNLLARAGVLSLVAVAMGALRATLHRERRTAEALKRFNEELDRLVRERTKGLARSVEELGLFTYTMAHDLRSPLRALHGFSDLLIQDHAASLPEEARTLLARIAGASRKMDRLILDLLEYGDLIHRPVMRRPTALAALCRTAVRNASGRIQASAADVRIEEPLPWVLADDELLTRVIEELLSNAFDFAAAGRSPSLRIRGGQAGDRAVVWVEDNGVGIAPEHRHRIFLPFQQLSPPADDRGTGMGLALAQKSLERMGGSIDVESTPGSGSTFRIQLPLCREP